MKKILFFMLILLLTPTIILAKEEVYFSKCIDGDTANIIKDGEEIKIRMLAVDTPETKHPTKGVEPFGKEASTFTCNTLKNANKLEIEYDENSDKKDKYDRELVWLFADGNLIQESLVEKGLAKVAYLYDDYKYTDILLIKEKEAKKKKFGIWSNYENDVNYIVIVISILIIITLMIISTKYRNKVKSKIKRKVKNKIRSEFKKIIK